MTDETTWYGPDVATFGDRLAAARDAAGMTQEDLAKRLGIKSKSLQSWEDDLAEPRANRLSLLAGLLNVSMMWLINGEGEGLSAPEDDPDPVDLREILTEIRAMQVGLRASAERLGRLEKTLRKAMAAGGE